MKSWAGWRKGAEDIVWGCLQPRAGGRCYREGRRGFHTQWMLKFHISLWEDAKNCTVQNAISQIPGKKNPFGTVKKEGVVSGQEVFGPQIVAVCKQFRETPALSCHLLLCLQVLSLPETGNNPGSSLICLYLIFWFNLYPIHSTFEEKHKRLLRIFWNTSYLPLDDISNLSRSHLQRL